MPGSHHFHWRTMFQPDGADLRPRASITAELVELGYNGTEPVVPYCTRGIRSSFAAAVLTWAGFDVRNFVGAHSSPPGKVGPLVKHVA